MNEIIFFSHIFGILIFLAFAARRGMHAHIFFVAISAILANFFVMKQMTLFGIQVTCSDVYAVGGVVGLNLLREFHGKVVAAKAVKISLFGLILFVAMSQMHLLYVPNAFDVTEMAYHTILSSSPRIIGSSIVVYYVVQRCDLLFFSWTSRFVSSLGFRLFISLIVSQALDTVLFSFLGLYGLVGNLFDVIVMSFAIKCVIISSCSPIASFFRRFCLEAEKT